MKKLLKSKKFAVRVEGKSGITLPDSIVKPFIANGFKRAKLEASYKNHKIIFHGALQKRNEGYRLMFSKSKQNALELSPGTSFQLQLFEDTTKYGVVMPEALEAVLNTDPVANSIFESLTDGKKRSIIYYIKRIKNIQRKVDKSLLIAENLKVGLTDLRELTRAHR